jgi:hypothetical protein
VRRLSALAWVLIPLAASPALASEERDEIDVRLHLRDVPHRSVELAPEIHPEEWLRENEIRSARRYPVGEEATLVSFPMDDSEWAERQAALCDQDGVRSCETDLCQEIQAPEPEAPAAPADTNAPPEDPNAPSEEASFEIWLQGSAVDRSEAPLAGTPVSLVREPPSIATALLHGPAPVQASAPGMLSCDPAALDTVGAPAVARAGDDGRFALPAPSADAHDRGCWRIRVGDGCALRQVPLRDVAPEFEPVRVVALVPLGAPDALQQLGGVLAGSLGIDLREAAPLPSIDRALLRFEVSAPGPAVEAALVALRADSRVELAQREYRYRTTASYTDPLDFLNYGPGRIGADRLHGAATGAGVKVAVIDTGVDSSHPELEGRVVDTLDVSGFGASADMHGTAIAGVIAAQPDNGEGAWGVAPGASLLAIKACQPLEPGGLEARCWSSTLAKAIDGALVRDARVINLSLGGPPDPLVARLVDAALAEGALVLAAAGNGGPDAAPAHPAALDSVLAVTAVDASERIWERATRGPFVDLAAPGVEIVGPAPGDAYPALSGTSLATAHASGAAALLLELDGTLTPAALRSALESSARDLGLPGPDDAYGHGQIDVCSAAAQVQGGSPACSAPGAAGP